MTRQRLPLLIAALVALLAVAWLTGVFESDPSTIDVPELSLDAEAIDRFDITTQADGSFSLVRENGAWRFSQPETWAADSSVIAGFVDELASLQIASLVSYNPDRHSRFGVDSTASEIVVYEGDRETRMVVSSTGPDFQSTYVRVGTDPGVYATGTRLALEGRVDRFRNRTIVKLDPMAVIAASISNVDEEYELRLTPGGWVMSTEDGPEQPADSTAVVTWLRRLNPLTADGFQTGIAVDSVLAAPARQLAIGSIDGSTTRISMVEYDGSWAVVSDPDAGVYRMLSSRGPSTAPASTAFTGLNRP